MIEHPLDTALKACIAGNPEESERILRSFPDQTDARVMFNLGWHEMRHGNLNKGLQLMDAGRFINVFGMNRIPGTIWRDEDLTNKTLLFRCENGIGDQIMNFRFAKDFQEKGARVVIACTPQLKSLFSRHGFVCIDDESIGGLEYDYWIPSMSAAHMLGYDQPNFPGSPYLNAKPRELPYKSGTLRVGIRWSGNPQFEHQQYRRFDPQLMIGLSDVEGVTFYSLQRDENLVDNLPFADLRNQMQSWEDTASIIAGLDLVITSCTSIAHCAAALGKETWVVVPVMPYYAWSYPGSKSAWYDTITIFRQKKFGQWEEPFAEIRKALKEKISYEVAA
jgi:hypothetical protein